MAAAGEALRTFDGLIENPGLTVVFTGYANPEVKESSDETWDIGYLKSMLKIADRANRSKKNLRTFVDFLPQWVPPADFDVEKLGDAWKNGVTDEALAQLPNGIRPCRNLADQDVMQVLIEENADSTYTVLKHFHLARPVSLVDIDKIVSGEAMLIPFRPNTFAARVAFQIMMSKTSGWQCLFATVRSPADQGDAMPSAANCSRGNKSEWNPSVAEIERGMAYIKESAPPSGSLEQVEWMLTYVKASDSAIKGWPLTYVQKCCDIKAKSKGSAELEHGFPLTVFNTKKVIRQKILPQVIRLLADHGVFIIGRPGAGKTPFGIILATGMGEFWIEVKKLLKVEAGWHRGKQFDDFKGFMSMVYNGYIIDDGHVPKFRMEDIKNYLSVGFQRHIDCRFCPVKIEKNAFSAIIDNTWDKTAEPFDVSNGEEISWDVFYGMIRPSVVGVEEDDLLAILKRSIFIIAGYRAVYVRLPSASKDQTIIAYTEDQIADDWFEPDDMWAYQKWQKGHCVYPTGFDQAKEAQRAMFRDLLDVRDESQQEQSHGQDLSSTLLRKKWSREWVGSQPEGLTSASPPGWYPLLDQATKDRLFMFVVDSVHHYGALTHDVVLDMSQKFAIDEISAFGLIRYFTSNVAEHFEAGGDGGAAGSETEPWADGLDEIAPELEQQTDDLSEYAPEIGQNVNDFDETAPEHEQQVDDLEETALKVKHEVDDLEETLANILDEEAEDFEFVVGDGRITAAGVIDVRGSDDGNDLEAKVDGVGEGFGATSAGGADQDDDANIGTSGGFDTPRAEKRVREAMHPSSSASSPSAKRSTQYSDM
jgi:hypothetical protein